MAFEGINKRMESGVSQQDRACGSGSLQGGLGQQQRRGVAVAPGMARREGSAVVALHTAARPGRFAKPASPGAETPDLL